MELIDRREPHPGNPFSTHSSDHHSAPVFKVRKLKKKKLNH